MKFRAILSLIILAIVTGFGLIACKKDKTCKVIVSVKDAANEPIVGASVKLWCDDGSGENQDCTVLDEKPTLTDGTAQFEFPNPGILFVFIDEMPEGTVILKEGEQVEKIIALP
jgi:hypothetical protein